MSEDRSVSLTPLTANMGLSGQGVAMIADQGSKVGLNYFNGGRSVTSRGEDGLIHVELSDSLLRGEPNEPSVLDVLGQLLPGTFETGDNSRGEDALLRTPENEMLTIQVVTVPPEEEINQQIGKGETVKRSLTDAQAAEWIAMSILKKLKFASPKTILALDARPFGILHDEAVLAAFGELYRELINCGFAQIWLVGPIAVRSARLFPR
jgi:hypothetical protein